MNRGLNKVMLIGSVGREPELRYTPDGKAVATFTLKTEDSRAFSGGDEGPAAEWFTVVAWGDLATSCHTDLSNGAPIYVEGRLQTRAWEDDSGGRNVMTEIVARDIVALGPGGETVAKASDVEAT